jgi:hypothetical protein
MRRGAPEFSGVPFLFCAFKKIQTNMSHPELGGELAPDEQMTFEQDVRELKEAGDRVGVKGLESRVKFGLDPAAMMVVR